MNVHAHREGFWRAFSDATNVSFWVGSVAIIDACGRQGAVQVMVEMDELQSVQVGRDRCSLLLLSGKKGSPWSEPPLSFWPKSAGLPTLTRSAAFHLKRRGAMLWRCLLLLLILMTVIHSCKACGAGNIKGASAWTRHTKSCTKGKSANRRLLAAKAAQLRVRPSPNVTEQQSLYEVRPTTSWRDSSLS